MSPVISARIDWDEFVASWNVDLPPQAALKVEARAFHAGRSTAYYTMGWWSSGSLHPRESVNGQKDDDGDVKTDTLVLNQPARKIQVRLSCMAGENGMLPKVKFLGLSFAGPPSDPRPSTEIVAPKASRQLIDVPQKSQLAYEGGRDWCSPTSVSMVLSYWAARLGRRELSNDVPVVAAAIYDRNWPGTGNWPFNAAYAGSFSGMRAWVTRFSSVSEIETWLARGVPVIASVSSDVLNDRPETGGGHLVGCVGFGEEKTILLNDPGRLPGDGNRVRRSISVDRFLRAWRTSRQTVYIIHPLEFSLSASTTR